MTKQRFAIVFVLIIFSTLMGSDNKYIWKTNKTIDVKATKITYKDNIVAVANNNTIYLFELQDINNINLRSSYIFDEPIEDMEVLSNGEVAVATSSITTNYSTNDEAESFGRRIRVKGYTGNDIQQEGANLYVAGINSGLTIYNLGRNHVEHTLSNYHRDWGLFSIAPKWPLLYTANRHGVTTVNLSNLENPKPFGHNYDIFETTNVVLYNNLLFASSGKKLNIIDISVPGKMKKFTNEHYADNIESIRVNRNQLFVCLGDGGLKIYTINEANEMYHAESYNDGSFILDVAFINDYLFVARDREDVKILLYK